MVMLWTLVPFSVPVAMLKAGVFDKCLAWMGVLIGDGLEATLLAGRSACVAVCLKTCLLATRLVRMMAASLKWEAEML